MKNTGFHIISYRDVAQRKEWFRLDWHLIERAEPGRIHSHRDFEEIFFIQSGTGTHYFNGGQASLSGGDLVFIRASDQHGFTGKALALVNLAFPRGHFAETFRRYATIRMNGSPFQVRLNTAEREWLKLRLLGLRGSKRTRTELDLFLIDLIRQIDPGTREKAPRNPSGIPVWLSEAWAKSQDPDRLHLGTRGLVELTGKSQEHVARAVRKYYGKTPTNLLGEARLQAVAVSLATTDRTIADLALSYGFQSFPYFYKRFRSRYCVSPDQYRKSARRIVGL